MQATLDATAEGIMVVDKDDQIVSFNRRLVEMWRIPDSVLSSGNRRKVTEFVSEQLTNPEEYRARVERVYQDSEAESNDILEFTDGRVFERVSRPQRVDGETVGRVWCFRDVTERKRLEERLSYQAFNDPLTGLPNRALFQDRLAHRRGSDDPGRGPAGHALRGSGQPEGGERLIGACRRRRRARGRGPGHFRMPAGSATRWPGWAATNSGSSWRSVAGPGRRTRLGRAGAGRPSAGRCRGGRQEIVVTASIGVAIDVPGVTTDQLLCNADLATFAAKELGGDRISEFTDRMHVAISPAS